MSKKQQLRNLATLIGLRAAHEILITYTTKPESIPHLNREADTYSNLAFDLAQANWGKEDFMTIRVLSKKECLKRLTKYPDLTGTDDADDIIENIMLDLGLR
ncbi:MAG: hypothetical protein ABH879_07005 [archaeon]